MRNSPSLPDELFQHLDPRTQHRTSPQLILGSYTPHHFQKEILLNPVPLHFEPVSNDHSELWSEQLLLVSASA